MFKRLIVAASLVVGFNLLAETSTPAGFTDNLDAALAAAKNQDKFVYVCFSGSDWCGWCIRLEKEVFSDPAFAAAVKDAYELVYIDSPRDKSRLSEHAKAHNGALTKAYKVRGFPTFVVLKGDGSEVTRGTAYRAGGAEAYAAFLKDIAADPGKIERVKRLKAEWIHPFEERFSALMNELNVACGKFMDDEAAKEENKAAGKTRDDFRTESIVIVKSFLPKFRALADEVVEKAAQAPAEISPALDDYAARLDHWIKMIEANK